MPGTRRDPHNPTSFVYLAPPYFDCVVARTAEQLAAMHHQRGHPIIVAFDSALSCPGVDALHILIVLSQDPLISVVAVHDQGVHNTIVAS
jgi:hypothetical protein